MNFPRISLAACLAIVAGTGQCSVGALHVVVAPNLAILHSHRAISVVNRPKALGRHNIAVVKKLLYKVHWHPHSSTLAFIPSCEPKPPITHITTDKYLLHLVVDTNTSIWGTEHLKCKHIILDNPQGWLLGWWQDNVSNILQLIWPHLL
jgi:hypothetical protein